MHQWIEGLDSSAWDYPVACGYCVTRERNYNMNSCRRCCARAWARVDAKQNSYELGRMSDEFRKMIEEERQADRDALKL